MRSIIPRRWTTVLGAATLVVSAVVPVGAAVGDYSWTMSNLAVNGNTITATGHTGYGVANNTSGTDYTVSAVCTLREDLSIGAIFSDPSDEDIAGAIEMGAAGIGIRYPNLCLRMVRQVLDAGLDLRAWNPDTLEEQKAMIALGVNGISTNRPDVLVEYLRVKATKE